MEQCCFLILQDGDFSEERFQNIVNATLANDIGNLLNRSLNLLHKFCDGLFPADSTGCAQPCAWYCSSLLHVRLEQGQYCPW